MRVCRSLSSRSEGSSSRRRKPACANDSRRERQVTWFADGRDDEVDTSVQVKADLGVDESRFAIRNRLLNDELHAAEPKPDEDASRDQFGMCPGVDEEDVYLHHPPPLPEALDEIDRRKAMFVHERNVFVDRGRADVVFDEGTFE